MLGLGLGLGLVLGPSFRVIVISHVFCNIENEKFDLLFLCDILCN